MPLWVRDNPLPEQFHAELVLKDPQLSADGRMRQCKILGRSPDGAHAFHCLERKKRLNGRQEPAWRNHVRFPSVTVRKRRFFQIAGRV